MARLGSLINMGYYKAPDLTTSAILNLLSFETSGKIHTLDPCAGEGIAMSCVSEMQGNINTYGVELHEGRYRASQEVLNYVINSSIFETEISHTFGFLWLNPPYADDRDNNGKPMRAELKFLIKCADYLTDSGVIVYLIPDYIVDNRLARYFTNKFTDISVYKFVKNEYPQFRQIAIIAKKKARYSTNDLETAHFIKSVRNAPHFNHSGMENFYHVPATPPPAVFCGKTATFEEIQNITKNLPLSDDLERITATADNISEIKTMMPIKHGHLAFLLAAGLLNTVIEKNGKRILVKGYSKKASIERKEIGEGKNPTVKIIKTERVITAVLYIDESGLIKEVV